MHIPVQTCCSVQINLPHSSNFVHPLTCAPLDWSHYVEGKGDGLRPIRRASADLSIFPGLGKLPFSPALTQGTLVLVTLSNQGHALTFSNVNTPDDNPGVQGCQLYRRIAHEGLRYKMV